MPLATVGEVRYPPIGTVQRRAPLEALNAYRSPPSEPTKTVRPATAGEELTAPFAVNDHATITCETLPTLSTFSKRLKPFFHGPLWNSSQSVRTRNLACAESPEARPTAETV